MTKCKVCEGEFVQPSTGRRRVYCSEQCRVDARRLPRASPESTPPGPLTFAIREALTGLPMGDDPRRRILAIELEMVAAELDADPTGRPALIAALERLVAAVFPAGLVLVDDEMPVDEWFAAMYGRRS